MMMVRGHTEHVSLSVCRVCYGIRCCVVFRLVVLCTRMALVNLYNLYVLTYIYIMEWICCDSVDMNGMRMRYECSMTVDKGGVIIIIIVGLKKTQYYEG